MTGFSNQKNIVIIGGSSSIGQAIFSQFKNAKVISTHTSHEPVGSDSIQLDLRSDKSIDGFINKVSKIMPFIDAAIFLAGILPGKSLEAYSFEKIDEVMAVNFNGHAKLIMKMLPLLTARSRLLLLSSISAQRGSFDPIYSASKGAVLSLVKSLAGTLPAGACINALAPGLIQDSQMYNDMTPERREYHRNQISSKKFLCQDDLAKIVFDLCQDHWAHLNGACIDINGGQYVR